MTTKPPNLTTANLTARSLTPGKRLLAGLCLGYLALMLYSSTVIGPAGLNFVYQDPARALRQFLTIRFVVNGSDQRADWMGNLLMLIPFGALTAGALWPRRSGSRLAAATTAMLLCATTILTIKYLQLFFPPRTVNLNYIAAQSVGAFVGIACFAVWHDRIGPSVSRQDPVAALVLTLKLYSIALLIFLLMPLDFALNATDLWAQVERLPDTMLALPGAGRPFGVRLILLIVAGAAFIPVGMLLVFVKTGVWRIRRGPAAAAAIGLVITTGIYAVTTLIMGAFPFIVSIVYRTGGIMIGAASLRWLTRQDMPRLRQTLRAAVPWMIAPYLLALLLVNQLLTFHWRTLDDVIAHTYPLGFIPLFDYYIVSKAAAAKNIVGHLLLYSPIGVGLWLRDGRQRGAQAFGLAAVIAFGVELARYFRPGMEGDINTVAVAGLAALLGMRLMPPIWLMLVTLAQHSQPQAVRQWDKRRPAPVRRDVAPPAAEIEDF